MKLTRIVAVVALSLLALTGCDHGGAGVAATVGGEKITTSDVDLLSRVTCDQASANPQQGQTTSPISLVRMQNLSALVNSALAQQLAKRSDVTYSRKKLLAAMTGIDQQLTSIAPDDRARLRALVEEFNIGQLELQGLGQQQLLQSGTKAPTDQDSLNEGYVLIQKYASTITVDIDPRYAPGAKDNPGGGVRSLSKAVSSYARQSDSLSPKPSWAMNLPPNQKCG